MTQRILGLPPVPPAHPAAEVTPKGRRWEKPAEAAARLGPLLATMEVAAADGPEIPKTAADRVTDTGARGEQVVAVLARLRQGPATTGDLAAIAVRFGARLGDLRRLGYRIAATPSGDTGWTYTLEGRDPVGLAPRQGWRRRAAAARDTLDWLRREMECRVAHGAESGGHLEGLLALLAAREAAAGTENDDGPDGAREAK